MIRQECFFHFWKAVEADRLQKALTRDILVDEIRYGAGEVTGDRKESDSELVPIISSFQLWFEPAEIHPTVEQCNDTEPDACEKEQRFAEGHTAVVSIWF